MAKRLITLFAVLIFLAGITYSQGDIIIKGDSWIFVTGSKYTEKMNREKWEMFYEIENAVTHEKHGWAIGGGMDKNGFKYDGNIISDMSEKFNPETIHQYKWKINLYHLKPERKLELIASSREFEISPPKKKDETPGKKDESGPASGAE